MQNTAAENKRIFLHCSFLMSSRSLPAFGQEACITIPLHYVTLWSYVHFGCASSCRLYFSAVAPFAHSSGWLVCNLRLSYISCRMILLPGFIDKGCCYFRSWNAKDILYFLPAVASYRYCFVVPTSALAFMAAVRSAATFAPHAFTL
jgi:hypothetical protein